MAPRSVRGPISKKTVLFVIVIIGGIIAVVIQISQRANPISPSEQLQTIINSRPDCTAPCWEGLKPGISTETDFLNLVESSPNGKFGSIKQNPLLPEGAQYIWYDRTTSLGITLEISDGLISLVKFQSDDLTVGNIIDNFGPPDKYTAFISEGETFETNLTLYYELLGLIVSTSMKPPDLEDRTQCKFVATTDTKVEKIYLVGSGSTDGIIKSQPRIFYFNQGAALPWHGLGIMNLTLCPN